VTAYVPPYVLLAVSSVNVHSNTIIAGIQTMSKYTRDGATVKLAIAPNTVKNMIYSDKNKRYPEIGFIREARR
jgi:hypothetical protein